MDKQFDTIVIGGGILGGACAISLARKLGPGQVALLESKVLGAGLSSRHSAIVRSVNRSRTAARIAKRAIALWQQLDNHWGVAISVQKPGALWIAPAHGRQSWHSLEQAMASESIDFHRLSQRQAADLCDQALPTDPEELYFHEPQALLLETGQVLTALQQAVRSSGVTVFEHCPVLEIERKSNGAIQALVTDQGRFRCKRSVNGAGAWSAEIFARCGLMIPVALEPVLAANFLTASSEIPENLPVIADHVNGFYFRRWPGSQLHVHRPRSRDRQSILAAFTRFALTFAGADSIYEAGSLGGKPDQIDHYRRIIRARFPQVGNPVPLSASISYFDITPDLGFILGPDPRAENLFHCLGAGQALKYAPVFGEILSALVCGEDPGFDLESFSIQRFLGKPLTDVCLPAQSGHF